MKTGRLGVWFFTERLAATAAAELAVRIEALGFGTLWLPETVGRDPFAHAAWLLAKTSRLNIATGIANIYHRLPGVTMQAQKTLAEQSGGRFLLGLGVSHIRIVEGLRKVSYGKPVASMRLYLEAMAASPYQAVAPEAHQTPLVIAALGPKMLGLARDLCQGAHPYFTSPEHTEMAREILGKDKWLCVEQKIILEEDAGKARQLARQTAQIYINLPNYRNNWLRLGLKESDLENGGSDAFIDTTFAWGSIDKIQARIQAHFDAGASHVCVQPVNPTGEMGQMHWQALEQIAHLNQI